MKEGVLDALLVQRPYDMGWRSLYGLLTIAEGYPEYVAGVNDTGMSVVTRDNVDTYDQKNDPLARPGKQLADMSYYFASPLVANPFWDDVQAGWEDACAFYGVNCEFAGPTVVDINEQLKYFEAAMAQNVDGIHRPAESGAVPDHIPAVNRHGHPGSRDGQRCARYRHA